MHPPEAARYAELVGRLQEVGAKVAEARTRTARLRRVAELVAPFGEGDGASAVQENLVTRGGAVETELERMRTLLARVGDRVGRLPPRETEEEEMEGVEGVPVGDLGAEERRRVEELLGRL